MTDAEVPLLDAERRRRPFAFELAVLASPAVVVEPELLRSLRLDVLPDAPASAEADVWFGPLVSSRSPDGFTFIPAVADLLRSELRERRATPAGVEQSDLGWALIVRRHAHLEPALALEERLAWGWIVGASSDALEAELGMVLEALATGRDGLIGWAGDAWRRLPTDVQLLPAAWVLRQAAPPELRPRLGLESAPDDIGGLDLSGALRHLPRVPLPVWRDGVQLTLGDTNPADPIAVLVPDTDPQIVEISAGEETEAGRIGPVSVVVAKGPERRIEVGGGSVRLRTLLGDVYDLPLPATANEAPPIVNKVDLLLEAGGIKLIALAGAVRALDTHGFEPMCVVGSSGGAVVAALLAPGYTGTELEALVRGTDWRRFADGSVRGGARAGVEMISRRGLHPGEFFHKWINDALAVKGVRTFADLGDPSATQPSRRYRLQVTASDMTDGAMLVLPRDASRLGMDPDEVDVAVAIRMSMSIPVVFQPVVVRNPSTGTEHVISDGTLLSNRPLWILDAPPGQPPQFPTFGVLATDSGPASPPDWRPVSSAIGPESFASSAEAPAVSSSFAADTDGPGLVGDRRGIAEYLKAIADIAMQRQETVHLEPESYARTIPISSPGIGAGQFDISAAEIERLFESGHAAAARFLQGWNFANYTARFRTADA